MKFYRRHQVVPPSACCRQAGCEWTARTAGGAAAVEDLARAHVTSTGHEVRIVRANEIILRPASQPIAEEERFGRRASAYRH